MDNKISARDAIFEVLAPMEYIRISRFPRLIRWLHWFNTLMILLLYALAARQIMELQGVGQFVGTDTRPWHWWSGWVWFAGMMIILGLIWWSKRGHLEKAIVSDKLIIEQKAFLLGSTVFVWFMIGTGVALFFLKDSDAASTRNFFLAIHIIAAILYIPALLMHIYMATIKKDTRQAMKTMTSDMVLEYVLHIPMEGLHCQLVDNGHVILLEAEVLEVSLKNFKAKLPKGRWMDIIDFGALKEVRFLHQDLSEPALLPIYHPRLMDRGDFYIVEFRYQMPMQESAKILLSRACFFRKLFLEQRRTPRYSFKIPVDLHWNDQVLEATTRDISKGGLGITLTNKIPKGAPVELQMREHRMKGKIVVKKRLKDKSFFYGVSLIQLSSEASDMLNQTIEELSMEGT